MTGRLSKDMLLRWYQMGDRERLVWASAFSAHDGAPMDAAWTADDKVASLKLLDIDDSRMPPEHVLAKAGLGVSYEEFVPWYRVAHRLTYGHDHPYTTLSAEDCRRAYETYQRSSTDFY